MTSYVSMPRSTNKSNSQLPLKVLSTTHQPTLKKARNTYPTTVARKTQATLMAVNLTSTAQKAWLASNRGTLEYLKTSQETRVVFGPPTQT